MRRRVADLLGDLPEVILDSTVRDWAAEQPPFRGHSRWELLAHSLVLEHLRETSPDEYAAAIRNYLGDYGHAPPRVFSRDAGGRNALGYPPFPRIMEPFTVPGGRRPSRQAEEGSHYGGRPSRYGTGGVHSRYGGGSSRSVLPSDDDGMASISRRGSRSTYDGPDAYDDGMTSISRQLEPSAAAAAAARRASSSSSSSAAAVSVRSSLSRYGNPYPDELDPRGRGGGSGGGDNPRSISGSTLVENRYTIAPRHHGGGGGGGRGLGRSNSYHGGGPGRHGSSLYFDHPHPHPHSLSCHGSHSGRRYDDDSDDSDDDYTLVD